jgi:NAD dependent epimerase/dehydratase family enzyme
MSDFARALGEALGRPSWAPVPAFVLRLALGEMADMLLTGQRVIPKAALGAGFPFRYPTLEAALRQAAGATSAAAA